MRGTDFNSTHIGGPLTLWLTVKCDTVYAYAVIRRGGEAVAVPKTTYVIEKAGITYHEALS